MRIPLSAENRMGNPKEIGICFGNDCRRVQWVFNGRRRSHRRWEYYPSKRSKRCISVAIQRRTCAPLVRVQQRTIESGLSMEWKWLTSLVTRLLQFGKRQQTGSQETQFLAERRSSAAHRYGREVIRNRGIKKISFIWRYYGASCQTKNTR